LPYWPKYPKKGARPINARAETAHEKPMFQKLIRERRCLIYYEWKQSNMGFAGADSQQTGPERPISRHLCG